MTLTFLNYRYTLVGINILTEIVEDSVEAFLLNGFDLHQLKEFSRGLLEFIHFRLRSKFKN